MSEAVCEICGGTGWEVLSEEGVSRARRCSCFHVSATTDKLYSAARIPVRFNACEFDNYVPDPKSFSQVRAKKMAMKYAESYPVLDDEIFREASLLFSGMSGLGKTHLAIAVLKSLMKKGIRCLFVDFHELLTDIRNSYDELSRTSEHQILRPILNMDVLLLDDLGSQRMTDWMQDTVFYIVNWRYNQKKPIIVTTNLGMEPTRASAQETLQDRLGYRVVSRLYEMCTAIELDGPDFRKEVRKAGSDFLRNRGEAGSS